MADRHLNGARIEVCDLVGVGRRFTKADILLYYAWLWRRPTYAVAIRAGESIDRDIRDLLASGYISEARGPKGGKGWRVEPSCRPEWVIGAVVGARQRRLGRYVPKVPTLLDQLKARIEKKRAEEAA